MGGRGRERKSRGSCCGSVTDGSASAGDARGAESPCVRFEGSWMHQERGKGRCRRRLLRFCPEHLQGGRRHFPRWEDGTQAQGKSRESGFRRGALEGLAGWSCHAGGSCKSEVQLDTDVELSTCYCR